MKTKPNTAFGAAILRLFTALAFLIMAPGAFAGLTASQFVAQFQPDSIGVGSSSKLTFTIVNQTPTPVTELAFTNTLPAGLVFADVPDAFTDCAGGTVTAPAGGTTLTFSGGQMTGNSSCTVSVNVTATTSGEFNNISGDLTSSAGNGGTASATLSAGFSVPGFTMSFSPSPVEFGGRSTLTYTIDNSGSESGFASANFTNTLPPGLVIADPANASTDAGTTAIPATITANPGGDVVSLDAPGTSGFRAIPAGAIRTVTVDVVANSVGNIENVTEDLNVTPAGGGLQLTSGFATAVLPVNPPGAVALTKTFVDDPVSPGGTVELRYTITNRDRSGAANGITFTDDLDAALTGLTAQLPSLPDPPCGAGSSVSGSSTISLTGGTLGAGESCTFSVILNVPVGADAGVYPSTSSVITATLDGSPVVGNAASDSLFVNRAPSITKTFLTNPVGSGGTVIARYEITNQDSVNAATDVSFTDSLSDFIPGLTATTLPAGFCGAGSTMTVTSPTTGSFSLSISGGSLDPGESCTFDVEFQLPQGGVVGTLNGITSGVTATIDGSSSTGRPAPFSLDVVGGLQLTKSFTDDPVLPGGTVTLEYTLSLAAEAPGDATGITFTDDLNSVISGLASTSGTQTDICGTGSAVSGTGVVTFSGGTLSPGEECTFSVTVQVPAAAGFGSFDSTSSDVSANMLGAAFLSPPAEDALDIVGLTLTHEFVGSPFVAGETATLRYTLSLNDVAPGDATGILFTHNLSDVISGLVSTSGGQSDICGSGSSLSGTSFLLFFGGSLMPGETCTFDVTVTIPGGSAPDSYPSRTSDLSATIDGNSVTAPASVARLEVIDPISITKSFTDDPVLPGGTVTLEYTITNSDTSSPATGISFTDDLDGALSGLASTSGTQNDICGAGSSISGTGLLTFTGGTLAPGESCTFSVSLAVPGGVPLGTSVVSTTSSITGMVEGIAVTGDPATDTLVISSVRFTKAFDRSPEPTENVTLTYTIENISTTDPISGLSFTDDLNAVVAGLAAVDTPKADVCGTGSLLSGTTQLAFTGGTLAPGQSCSFSVNLLVPANATPGMYPSVTSELSNSGIPLGVFAPATLTVISRDADLAVSVMESADPMVICPDGSVGTHTVVVTNNGPSSASGVVIATSQNLAPGVNQGSAVPSAGTFEMGAWTVGSLAPGQSETLVFGFTTDPGLGGIVDAIMTSASVAELEEDDPESGNDEGSATSGIVSSTDIRFTPVYVLDQVFGVYRLRVYMQNNNPLPISSARGYIEGLPVDAVVLYPDGFAVKDDPSTAVPYALLTETIPAGGTAILEFRVASAAPQDQIRPDFSGELLKEPEKAVRVTAETPYPYLSAPGCFAHPLTVKNIGAESIPGFRLFVDNLPDGVELQFPDGFDDFGMPAASLPYIYVAQPLDPGESTTVVVHFHRENSNRHFIPAYRTEVFAGMLNGAPRFEIQAPPCMADFPVGTAISIFRTKGLLIEWDVIEGRSYRFEFSEDLRTWKEVPGTVVATWDRLQWFDDGDVTLTHPDVEPMRFYRIIEVEINQQ